ncbi:MAG: energy transducer TonB, partial [Cetobacterium sp.]
MSRFYVFSICLHIFVGWMILKTPSKTLTFKNRQVMNISCNQMANNSGASNATAQTIPEPETALAPEPEPIPVTAPEPAPVPVPKPAPLPKKKPKVAKKTTANKTTNTTDTNTKSNNNNLVIGLDGTYTASSSEGIEYEFLKVVNPSFPAIAKRMGYKKDVIIRTKFLVDIDGKIKDVEILEGINKFGFREETSKALFQWRFKP